MSAGDARAAASEAIRGLGPQVLRYLRSLLQNEGDAADAFSLFGERLWKGIPGFHWDAPLHTWAYRLAWSAAVDVVNQAWRRKGRRLGTSEASRLAAEVRTHSAVRIERQRRIVHRMCDALSAEDRSLLVLRIENELSWEEIAAILSTDGRRPLRPNTIVKRFERIRERLATIAKDQGLAE